jgi:beta-glucosidase
MRELTRRRFGQAVASSAVAGISLPFSRALAAGAQTAPAAAPGPHPLQFPAGFVWGCATAAYQVEGAASEDGRGPSVWDTFSHTAGKTFEGQTGDVADDSYHLYPDDAKLMKGLGVKGYRLSISWSRIFPNGTGQPNDKGLAHYDRVIDDLLAQQIEPYITLFHWDLPQALPGGWQSRDTAKAFADYAGLVSRRLSDRVKRFMTVNELVCFTDLGYKVGIFAPGLKLEPREANQVRHHGVLAHGLAVQAIRASAKAGTEVGLAENAAVFVPVIETPAHIDAARKATRERNAPFLTAIMEGRYTDGYLAREGANAPRVEAGDMRVIGSPIDFLGLNVYTPDYVRADPEAPDGYRAGLRPKSSPHMASPWLFIGPESIYWGIRNISEVWKPRAIYITENGCSSDDVLTPEGRVEDTDRLMYLRNHLVHLQRAAAEGYPVKGYFLWSLLDNFEWADGYSKRFGLHYVDFATRKRTPKLSAEWYREVISHNAVV